jgi:phosphonate dehydrogenase
MKKKPPKIVVTNPVHQDVLARLEKSGTVVMNSRSEPWTPAQLARNLRDADAMMGFMTDCVDAELLQMTPNLRVVACALKGFDSYDVAACTKHGIWLTIVPDLLTEPTAELAIGLAIGLARNVIAGNTLVRSGKFNGWRPRLYGRGLAGSTVAIIGLGKVGKAIADRLKGFGCARLLGVDPAARSRSIEMLSLRKALSSADYVFVAAPLTSGTHHLIAADALSRCKKGQLMINVGRGSVLDENAVADALEEGVLAGYAADVFAFEDWALNSRPLSVPARLRNHPGTLFTPHLGSAVTNVRRAIEHRAADNIIAVLSGHSPADAINRPPLPRR